MENRIISVQDWVMRVQRPEGIGPFPVTLMLHGWTGDEDSMWVFAPRLIKNSLLIAPRGLFNAKGSGYSWHPEISKPWPWIDDLMPAAESLLNIITSINFPEGNFSDFHLIGFSQGAALAYTVALFHAGRFSSLAGLSGFLPDGATPWINPGRLRGMPVFIAHGTDDDLVPIERARMSVGLLEEAGASVSYCEDNVGHKLSAKCFRGLEAFYLKVGC